MDEEFHIKWHAVRLEQLQPYGTVSGRDGGSSNDKMFEELFLSSREFQVV
jgi:hypothetical protein